MLQCHTIGSQPHLPSRIQPVTVLLPVMAAVFIAFLIIGFALPVGRPGCCVPGKQADDLVLDA